MRNYWTAIVLAAAVAASQPIAAKESASGSARSHASASYSSSSHGASRGAGGSHRRAPQSVGAGHRETHASLKAATSHSSGPHKSTYAADAKRDPHGRIARSKRAKDDFKKQNPCPSTGKTRGSCPGYVIDHVTPLKRGGADAPSNMQWQTTEAAKLKDRTE